MIYNYSIISQNPLIHKVCSTYLNRLTVQSIQTCFFLLTDLVIILIILRKRFLKLFNKAITQNSIRLKKLVESILMKKVTIADVANHANVSRATVSRVLNHKGTVNPILEERVLMAVRELGYKPNRAAQRLRSNTSDIIGVIVSDIQSPFFVSVVRGIEDAAYTNRMNIVLCNADEDLERQQTYLSYLQAENVAGIIVSPTWHMNESNELEMFQNSGIPIILMDRIVRNYQFDTVSVDNVDGAYTATKHLIDLGYCDIAILGGNLKLSTGKGRYDGYIKAMQEAQLPIKDEFVIFGNFTEADGYRLTKALMSKKNRPEAIFVNNNLSTMGALKAIREMGLRMPDDVALISFDDIPMAAELITPLTAIAQPTHEMGSEAVRLLLRRLKKPSAPIQSILLQTQLIVRESCGSAMRLHESKN